MFDWSRDIEHLRERGKERYGEGDRAIREIVDIEIRCAQISTVYPSDISSRNERTYFRSHTPDKSNIIALWNRLR